MPVTFTPTQEQEDIRKAFATKSHLVIQAGAGTGKALRNDQRVLTPSGFKPISALLIGDEVIGSDGAPTQVLGVYPQGIRPLFKVTTSDGVSIIADADHLWLTQTTRDRQKHRGNWTPRSTEEIAQTLTVRHGSRDRINHYLPMLSQPVQGSTSLPLDPWLIGILLGDGGLTGSSVNLSNSQPGILNAVRETLPEGVFLDPASANAPDGLNWRVTARGATQKGRRGFYNPVTSALRELGMMGCKSVDKSLPEAVFSAPAEQRLAVLQGLLDTDSSVHLSSVEYCTSSEKLAVGVRELVQSLGGTSSLKSRIPRYVYRGERREGARSWRIHISLPLGMSPFRYSENAQRYTPRSKYPPRRQIVSVTPVAPDYATCIKVAAEDRLFVTEGFVLTHNTSSLKLLASDLHDADPGAMAYYIAFNKAMAAEVENEFDDGNVLVSTIHAMAYRALRNHPAYSPLLDRLNADNTLAPWEVARHFRVRDPFIYKTVAKDPEHIAKLDIEHDIDDVVPGVIYDKPKAVTINPDQLCLLAQRTLSRWCSSDRDSLDQRDVPRRTGMSLRDHYDRLVPVVLDIAKKMWDTDIIQPSGRLRFDHGYYVKMWALTRPSIPDTFMPGASRTVLFFDEAQDAQPVVAGIVRDNMDRMQVVSVGDSNQAIYGWLGVIDYLGEMSELPGVITLPLSQSWRFGAHVSNLANDVLKLLPGQFAISGNPSLGSMVLTVDQDTFRPEADAIICRSNGQLLSELLFELNRGRKVFCQTNTSEILRICKDITALRNGKKAFHPDMKFFNSLRELEDYLGDPDTENSTFVTMTRLIIQEGEGTVSAALDATTKSPEKADVVISTIHKAKGCEWDQVRIVGDPRGMFPVDASTPIPVPRGSARDALMLLYVAITRAKKVLYIDTDLYDALQSGKHARPLTGY